ITMWLEWVVLTGVRQGEARQARWGEVNLRTLTWTAPAQHVKQRTRHQRDPNNSHPIPITRSMVAILKTLQADGHDQSPDAFLFPALFTSREHDPSQVSRFIRETLTPYIQESTKLTDIKFTAHGFARSTLKDWWTAKGYPEALWKLQV